MKGVYVYAVIDPRSPKQIFHLGKDCDYSDLNWLKDKNNQPFLNKSIGNPRQREIIQDDLRPEFVVLRQGLTEEQADLLIQHYQEWLLIFGNSAVEQLKSPLAEITTMYREFQSKELVTDLPIVLIHLDNWIDREKANWGKWDKARLERMIFAKVRKWGKFGEKRERAKYALAMYRGWVIGVYQIERWSSPYSENYLKGRYKFSGKILDENSAIYQEFIHKITYAKNGVYQMPRNPIQYRNCDRFDIEHIYQLILQDANSQSALIEIENEEQRRTFAGFADRYHWQVKQVISVHFDKSPDSAIHKRSFLVKSLPNSRDFHLIKVVACYLKVACLPQIKNEQQLVDYFTLLTKEKFQNIAACQAIQLPYAGSLMGKWARDTAIDRIIKEIQS
ncbi:hypothetical protein A1D22_09690 [Pasteurellaceae bacterium LFhippo2]|nr:hypothetical protein [Pasteurellaceae bacterium LFhippo2]